MQGINTANPVLVYGRLTLQLVSTEVRFAVSISSRKPIPEIEGVHVVAVWDSNSVYVFPIIQARFRQEA